MADILELRGYQIDGVKLFGRLKTPRFFFTWDMGAGKTIGAISVAKAYNRQKVCVVCPAVVRDTWVRAFRAVWPERPVASVIYSRTRKGLSKPKATERDLSYQSGVQVVSYDLVGEITPTGWDMLIVDEFHNLRSPESKQSNQIRALFRANPAAWALGLSGTPIPNEAQQLWNPVDIFFKGLWGRTNSPGRVPWTFLNRFANKEVNEYGTRYFGVKDSARAELAEKFAKVSNRVTQEQFAKYLPPLFVEPLFVDEAKLDKAKFAASWYDTVKAECKHVGIYTHLRQTAANIRDKIAVETRRGYYIDGSVPAATRDAMLQEARGLNANGTLIIGTTHALKEGVSLSFQKTVLVMEWTTAVDEVVQFIARFARQDSTSQLPTRIQFVVGPNDTSRSELLSRRLADISSIIRPSRADNAAVETFAERELSDEDYLAEIERMVLRQSKLNSLGGLESDDDDED